MRLPYVFSKYPVIVEYSIFKNNVGLSGVDASALQINNAATFSVVNCMFEQNEGTVIRSSSKKMTINESRFINNTGEDVINFQSQIAGLSFSMMDCVFENNSKRPAYLTFLNDGSYSNPNYNINISGCKFTDNCESMYLQSYNPIAVTDCLFKNNTGGDGGAIYLNGGISISNSTFDNNNASQGGAIYVNIGTIPTTILNCTFYKNSANKGGAIYFDNSRYGVPPNTTNCTFSNNLAHYGGAVLGRTYLTGNIFSNNMMLDDEIPHDVYDNVSSKGYNIYTANQKSFFTASTDYRYTGTVSLLMPLENYGGRTTTMPVKTSIENWENIIRIIPYSVTPERKTDQRGLPIPTAGKYCAGSVEIQEGEYFRPSKIIDIKGANDIVFPNPVKDVIYFYIEKETVVKLFDVSGRQLQMQLCKAGKNSMNISVYSKGIYFFSLGDKIIKIIKSDM
jgi:predicted outer membrane repeat protein